MWGDWGVGGSAPSVVEEDDVKVLRSKVLEETIMPRLTSGWHGSGKWGGTTHSRAICKNRVGRRAASAALRGLWS